MGHHRCGETGAVLLMDLGFVTVGILIVGALLAFLTTSTRSADAYRSRDEKILAEQDAINVALHAMRPNLEAGRQGDIRSFIVAGVTATCSGLVGSGQLSGAGRTDRNLECVTPQVTVRARIFDRSGDAPGVILEVLDVNIDD